MPTAVPLYKTLGFTTGNVPPAGNFLLVQKVTKDTPGGGAVVGTNFISLVLTFR